MMDIIRSIRHILENTNVVSTLNNMAGKSGPIKPISFPKPNIVKKVPLDSDGNHTSTTVTKVAGLIGKNPKKLFQVNEW